MSHILLEADQDSDDKINLRFLSQEKQVDKTFI